MKQAPIPENERQRLRALYTLDVLDTPPEERFDRITRLAKRIFDAPIVLVSLIDAERQWFKSRQGVSATEMPRPTSFCGHTILSDEALIVPDARQDDRFADNPFVTGEPHIRFYAGHPLAAPDGSRVGTLCVVDFQPRRLNDEDLELLKDLALLVESEFNLGEVNYLQKQLVETNQALQDEIAQHHRLAEALRESETKFRTLVEHAPEAIVIVDDSGAITLINSRTEEMFGYERAEILGRNIEILLPDRLRDIHREHRRKFITNPAVRPMGRGLHLIGQRKNGAEFPVEIGLSFIDAGGGRLVISYISDITTRQQAAQALRESEERLQQVFSSISDHIYVTEFTQTGQRINRYLSPVEALTGYPLDRLMENWSLWSNQIIHPEDRAAAAAQAAKFAQGQNSEVEYRLIRADDRIVWVRDSGRVERDSTSGNLLVYGVVSDITARKKAEETLRAVADENLRLAQAVASVTEGIVITDPNQPENPLIYANPAFTRITGYTVDEVIGRNCRFLQGPDSEAHTVASIRRGIAKRRKVQVTLLNYRKDGTPFWNELKISPIFSPEGELLYFVGIQSDITARKQSDEERNRFTNQLRTAADVSKQITAILEPDLLLEEVVTLLQSRFDLYHVHIYLLDETRNELVMRAGSGEIGKLLRRRGHKIALDYKHSLVARAARRQEIRAVDDVSVEPDFMPNPLLPETKAEVAVPLIAGDQVLGVFDVQDNRTNRFSQSDLNSFSVLSGQIAIALQNARLFEEQKQTEQALLLQEKRLRSLHEITTHSTLSVEERFEAALVIGAKLLDLETGIICRIEENKYTVLHCYTPDDSIHQGQVFELEKTFCALTVEANSMVSIDSLAASPYSRHPGRLEFGLEAYTGIPLWVGGDQFGALDFSSRRPRTTPFTRADEDFVQLMGEWISRTIERTQAEEALRQSEARNRAILDAIPDLMFRLDRTGRYLDYKASADNLYLPPHKFLGKTVAETMPAEVAELTVHHIEQALETNTLQVYEYQLARPGESLEDFESRLTVSGEEEVLALVRNITGRKQAERTLAQARDQALEASRLKSELLAKVSHELRTPLTAILGFAEMLEFGIYGDMTDRHLEPITEIIDSTKYLTILVNELLDQAQLDVGKLKLNIMAFDPADLVEDTKSKMSVLAQTKGLALTVGVAPNTPSRVWGDSARIRQVLVNLISNAVKFTDEGNVQLNLYSHDPHHWALQVLDTGPGIAKEDQERIFEAFQQVDGSITRKHRGHGLGLSIVQQLTHLMGGRVTLKSNVGKGSCFTVILPVRPQKGDKKA